MFVYIIFNIFAATAIYWLARMPKGKKFQGKASKDDLALVKTKSNATSAGHRGLEKETGVPAGSYEKANSTPLSSSSYGARTPPPPEGSPEITTSEKIDEARAEEKTQEKKGDTTTTAPKPVGEAQDSSAAAGAVPERPPNERFTTASEF